MNCPEPIGLLIIDGPPFETQNKARYPALFYFYSKLAKSTTVIVHDVFRKEEAEIVEDWLREYPEFTKGLIHSEKGIAILKR